jgi:hypothetical protein
MDVESLLDVVEYTLAEALAAAVGLIAGAFTGLLFRVLFVSLEQALASFTVAVPALHQTLSQLLFAIGTICAIARAATNLEKLAVSLSLVTAFLSSMSAVLYWNPLYAFPLFLMYLLLLIRAALQASTSA